MKKRKSGRRPAGRRQFSKVAAAAERQKEKKREWKGVWASSLMLLIGSGFLVHGVRTHYLNSAILGFVCLSLGMHHYLRANLRSLFKKKK